MQQSGFIRRTDEDYAEAFAKLLPQGVAWPRDLSLGPMQIVQGLSKYWGTVDRRAADLLERESDPRITIEMLDRWEEAFGLPDPCIGLRGQTNAERHSQLMLKMTLEGGSSRQFFIDQAARLGYTIRITEHSPYQSGMSTVGWAEDEFSEPRWETGPPEYRYWWLIHVSGNWPLRWFRVGADGGEVGIDHMLESAIADDLECLIYKWKPGHTTVTFDYTSISNTTDPYADLP